MDSRGRRGTAECADTDLGVGHLGEAQLLDEVIDTSLLLTLRDGGGQPQGGGKTQVLPDGQRAHDHVLLGRDAEHLGRRSERRTLRTHHESLREHRQLNSLLLLEPSESSQK